MGHPPRGRSAGPRRDEPAIECGQDGVDLPGGRGQSGDQALAHPSEDGRGADHALGIVAGGNRVELPAGTPADLDSSAAFLFDPIERAWVVPRADLLGHLGAQRSGPALSEPGDGQHHVDQWVFDRCRPQHVQASPDLSVLQLAQVAVDVEEQIVEGGIVERRRAPFAARRPLGCAGRAVLFSIGCDGGAVQPQIPVDLGRDHELPHLAANLGKLGRIERGHLGVGVQESLELGQVVVQVGPGQGRNQMVDDDGVGTPFGLGSLPGIVHHERIDEGQVAQRRIGET